MGILEGVLFDLDGTLVDTAPDFIIAVNRLRKSYHLDQLPAAGIAEQVSNGSIALTQYAFNIDTEDASFTTMRQALLDNYLDCIGQQSILYNGLDQLLMRLNKASIPWGIVTNKPILYAEPLLAQLGLLEDCDVLVCPDHVRRAKPDPEALLMAAEKIKSHVSATVYIGDHDRDIAAGRAAGMKTIAAAYGYINDQQKIDDWHADSIVKQPRNIHPTLERLFSCTI